MTSGQVRAQSAGAPDDLALRLVDQRSNPNSDGAGGGGAVRAGGGGAGAAGWDTGGGGPGAAGRAAGTGAGAQAPVTGEPVGGGDPSWRAARRAVTRRRRSSGPPPRRSRPPCRRRSRPFAARRSGLAGRWPEGVGSWDAARGGSPMSGSSGGGSGRRIRLGRPNSKARQPNTPTASLATLCQRMRERLPIVGYNPGSARRALEQLRRHPRGSECDR